MALLSYLQCPTKKVYHKDEVTRELHKGISIKEVEFS